MILTPACRAMFRAALAILDRLPDEMWVELDENGLAFQASTQEKVRAVRAIFPGTIWRKSYVEVGYEWWEYNGVSPEGVPVKIYACSEAPPTCRLIEESREVEEDVPVQFERRLVTKTVRRWECDGTGETA